MSVNIIVEAFDYAALDAETRIVVQQRTSEIHERIDSIKRDFTEIGKRLTDVKVRLPYGYWGAWLESEFGWSQDTATNLMNAAKLAGKIPNFSESGSQFAQTAMYVLGAKATPPEAVKEAVERANHGERITGEIAKEIVASHKPTNSRPAGVRSSSAGAEPDLDEDGLPLVQHMDSAINTHLADIVELDEEDEDEGFRLGDIVEYRGQRCTVFGVSSAGRVSIKTSRGQPLVGIDPEREVITLIERAAKPAPLAEEIVQLDGVPVAESHPMGWQIFFIESSWATCVNCGESHPRWSFVRGGDWRCEQQNCKQLTHDDLLIPYTKADAVEAQQRHPKRNGHKPPIKDPLMTSESQEWYTPEDFVALVRQVLGTIDVDPASCAAAQAVVQADDWYDETADGLAQLWFGTVYLNPPYGRDIGEWVEKLIGEYKRNLVSEAILLTPARTDTEWFRLLRTYPRCFVSGRLKFWNSSDATPNSAPFPSVVFYLGGHPAKFAQVFGDIGDIYSLWSE